MQGLHKEGECRQLEFWTGKSYVRDTYSAHLQMSKKITENYFEIFNNYWRKELPEGATWYTQDARARQAPQARPGGLWAAQPTSGAHLLVHKVF